MRDGDRVQRPKFLITAFASALATLVLSESSPGAELAYEPFDYPTSLSAGLSGSAGGSGWSAAWTDGAGSSIPTIASTYESLQYPTGVQLSESGGRVEVTATAVNDPASRIFTTPIDLSIGGQTFYSSALFRRSAATGELTSILFENGTLIRWYYGIDTTGFFSVAVDPTNAAQRATSTFGAAADTTYLLVARLRTNTGPNGNDEAFLQVFQEGDPIAEPASDADWDLRVNGNSGLILDRLRLSMSNTAGQTNAFDEFRLGTSFADVTGIPEPTSLALMSLGVLLVARQRRRLPR